MKTPSFVICCINKKFYILRSNLSFFLSYIEISRVKRWEAPIGAFASSQGSLPDYDENLGIIYLDQNHRYLILTSK